MLGAIVLWSCLQLQLLACTISVPVGAFIGACCCGSVPEPGWMKLQERAEGQLSSS
jgi:hypothetical protein